MQDCSNSIAYALELLQSCIKPSKSSLLMKSNKRAIEILTFFFIQAIIPEGIVCYIISQLVWLVHREKVIYMLHVRCRYLLYELLYDELVFYYA